MSATARASWRALGTSAAVVVAEPGSLPAARAAVERELDSIDAACSRFRDDSELTLLNRAAAPPLPVGPLLYEAIEVALRAAAATGGLVDPTIGRALQAIGYDRDFDAIAPDGPEILPIRAAGWECVLLDPEARTVQLTGGAMLDLGATAKAWAADRAAASASAAAGAPVLVDLGGDIAVSGAPAGGWPVAVADDHAAVVGETVISIAAGGLATSSTTVRRWRRGGKPVHHIVDPATGRPADSPWRAVSVAAATCVDANAASTAAIVLGGSAPGWLADRGLPARLVRHDGSVVAVGGWPAATQAA